MSRFFSKFFIAMVMTVGLAVNAIAEVVTPPQGEYMQYLSECNYSWSGSSWNYSNTMVQNVTFENGNLFIENLCGAGWAVGTVNEDEHYAAFQLPQQVNESHTLYAYIEGEEGIELSEVFFDFTEDRNEIKLRNEDGKRVHLKAATQWGGIWWSDVKLTRWTERPTTPPEDGDLSYFKMDYVNTYESQTRLVEMVVKDDNVWMKDFVESGYLKGKIIDNGNIRFQMPQYMGLNGNYIKYTFGIDNGIETDYVDLIPQNEGGYVIKEGMQLWGGERHPEYCLINSASFTPVSMDTAVPVPPTDAVWSIKYDNCFDFELSSIGANGENIPIEWLYWQVLIDGEPFIFTSEEYPELEYSIDGGTDMLQASLRLFTMLPSYDSLDWGNLGNGKYRCYLPSCSEQDNVSVRIGCKMGDSPVQWSESVRVVKETTPNSLPVKALYFTYVSYDTQYGPCADNGIAMYADYGAETMQLSGFFGHSGYVEGEFTDESLREVLLVANQVIGVSDKGLPITLVPATASKNDPSDPYSSLVFSPLEKITLKIGPEGESVVIKTPDVYLLEVTGEYITNVWCPGIKLSLVTDSKSEIPESASLETYKMTYSDIRGDEVTTELLLAFDGNEIWIEFNVQSNWFYDADTYEKLCLKGIKDNNSLVFNLPQFVGVTENYISYATADPWSFWPTELIFEKDSDTDTYVSNQQIWIGTGEGYPVWLAAEEMSINMNTVSVNEVKSTGSINFVDGVFIDSEGADVEVFNLSGMKLTNRSLSAGTYIVVANGKTKKMSVR